MEQPTEADSEQVNLSTVAAKNVTLSAKLFFLTTEPYKKMPLNPYKHWAPCR